MNTLLSINNYYYRRGGAETVFFEHNELFQEIGWKIIPFSMHHKNNFISEWESHFVDPIEFGEQYSLPQKLARAQKVTFSFEASRKITKLIDVAEPSIAHAHNVYHHISPSIFGVLKKRGIPIALTLHDLKIACPAYKMLTHDGICERCKNGKLWNVVLNRCLKDSLSLSTVVMIESFLHRTLGSYSENVDQFIVPSKFYIEKFVEWGWPREKFRHIPNFINIPRKPDESVRPGKAFLFMGRLSSEKGVAGFIQAIALADAKGWIVGTGPEETQLKYLSARLKADIEFFGYRSGDELTNIIQGSRALVVPSEWYENAPMCILEAYSQVRPVIGARIGGIPELILDGESGTLFASGDIPKLAHEMQRFASMSDETILRMGKAGRNWAQRDFSAEKYRSDILQIYREMREKT